MDETLSAQADVTVSRAVPIAGLAGVTELQQIRRAADRDDPLGGTELGSDIAGVLARRHGRGQPLPLDIAGPLGDAMGADLAAVRIHTGSEPAHLARSVQATAFTQGTDIYFGAGTYAPHTAAGQRILAHEVAHTVQPDFSSGPGRSPIIGRASDPAEAHADRVADSALRVLQRRAASDRAAAPGHHSVERRPAVQRTASVALLRRLSPQHTVPGHVSSGRAASPIRRFLAPNKEQLKAESVANGHDALHETITTLFHRLHAAGLLIAPETGKPFPSAADALKTVMRRKENDPDQWQVNYSAYERILQKSNLDHTDGTPGGSPIQPTDWTLLEKHVVTAAQTAGKCATAKMEIFDVFGHSNDVGKAKQPGATKEEMQGVERVFTRIAKRLSEFTEKNFHVDYVAHPATGGGGASKAGSGIITVQAQTLRADPVDIVTTIIHEAAHEVAPTIDDIAYRTENIFLGLRAKMKLVNADHYAEVADQLLRKKSRQLIPKAAGPSSGGDKLDDLISQAQHGIRTLWDLSLNMYDNILPKLAPGINFDTGLPLGDAPDTKKLLKTATTQLVEEAYGLPPSKPIGSPAQYALIGTTTVMLNRAMNLTVRNGQEAEELLDEAPIVLGDSAAFRLASSLVFKAGGLHANRRRSDDRHRCLAMMYPRMYNKSLYG